MSPKTIFITRTVANAFQGHPSYRAGSEDKPHKPSFSAYNTREHNIFINKIVKEIVNETRQIYQTVLVPNCDEYSILYHSMEQGGPFIPYRFIKNIKFNE